LRGPQLVRRVGRGSWALGPSVAARRLLSKWRMREETCAASGPAWRRTAMAAAAVAALAIAPYAGTLTHGFAFDDAQEVVRNLDIRSLADVPRLFARGAWDGAGERNPIYRPLTGATYALNYALAGLSP